MYSFIAKNVDGWNYVVYALDEKALYFLAEYLGVKLNVFEHHEVEKPFLNSAHKAGFKVCGQCSW